MYEFCCTFHMICYMKYYMWYELIREEQDKNTMWTDRGRTLYDMLHKILYVTYYDWVIFSNNVCEMHCIASHSIASIWHMIYYMTYYMKCHMWHVMIEWFSATMYVNQVNLYICFIWHVTYDKLHIIYYMKSVTKLIQLTLFKPT